MTDHSRWKPLTPAFTAAIRAYDQASRVRLRNFQVRNAITAPLYHYTNRGGLEGIITGQQFWFTHYQHLNDDNEIRFGMEVAKAMLEELGARTPKAKLFCDMVIDLFSVEHMNSAFGFYIASFSRDQDDPHQWQKYGQDGRGFAIGVAPKAFRNRGQAESESAREHFRLACQLRRRCGPESASARHRECGAHRREDGRAQGQRYD